MTLPYTASVRDLETKILSDFSDILPPNTTSLVLQVKDESWGLFVDLQKDNDLEDRSIVNVVNVDCHSVVSEV